MTEDDFKKAIENVLMMQNNNDANFQILQAQNDRLQSQIDGLKQQLSELNDLKEMFRLPKPENKDRQLFEVIDE
jgi:prefoldin subunit 5